MRREEVEHHGGDNVGLLDVHEVADVLERSRTAPPGGRYGTTSSGLRAPAHLLQLEAEHAEERHRQARQALQRPLRAPRAEAAEAHRRVDLPAPAVGVLARADRREVAQPLAVDRRGFIRARRARQLVERAGLARRDRPCARRWSSQASSSSREQPACARARRRRACRRLDGRPSRLTRWLNAVRHARRRAGSSAPPPLEWPMTGAGVGRVTSRSPRARRGCRRPSE